MSTTTSNLKQRFIRLLRKFKLPETEAFESEEQYKGYMEQVMAQNDTEIDDFLDEDDIGDFSDSGQEFDDISISSTPKPSLKPYFSTWTLEGPRDSTSISNTFIEGAATTSNSHHSNSNINLINSPLSSSSTTTHTTTNYHTTTNNTTTTSSSINNTSSTSSSSTTTNTLNSTPIVAGGKSRGDNSVTGNYGESNSSVNTPPGRNLQKQNSEDKKSSKLRRILRKKDSTIKSKK